MRIFKCHIFLSPQVQHCRPRSACLSAALKEGLVARSTPSGSAATAAYFALARQMKFQVKGWTGWHHGDIMGKWGFGMGYSRSDIMFQWYPHRIMIIEYNWYTTNPQIISIFILGIGCRSDIHGDFAKDLYLGAEWGYYGDYCTATRNAGINWDTVYWYTMKIRYY